MKNLFKKTINKGLLNNLCVAEDGVLPFFKEFAGVKRCSGCYFEAPIYAYLEFLSQQFKDYKKYDKYGEYSFKEYIEHSLPGLPKEDQKEEEEQSLPVLDAKEVIAKSVGRFAEWLSETYDENSVFTLDEVLTEIGNFVASLDDEEADNED